MEPTSGWRLSVLGNVTLEDGSGRRALERKTAALLTYLALEGPTSRSKLAGLFWPERGEKVARNNLVQLFRRLRALTGDELVTGSDLLATSPALAVDAATLKLAMFARDYPRALELSGELLATCDYDDLPDFSDWLYGERERLAELRRDALQAEAAKLEAAGDLAGALEYAHALIEHDPVAEDSYRLAMRLHYLAGNHAAATRVFERCREFLRRELDVGPLAETLALMREIEAGRVGPPPERPRPSIPLSVLRPPALVGREREWAQLEDAWEAGKLIVVSGPPGAGKTRLMMDFVADKTRVLKSEGRPGDAAVPFLSLTRSFRRFFAMAPELVLETWIAQELSRLLPDLFAEAPPAEDPLRFHEAMYHVARLVADHTHAIVIDDYQFYDSSSFESGARATSQLVAEGLGAGQARTLVAFRSGEMPAAFLEALSQLVEQDLAVHIELAPLSHQATAALLSSLGLEELSADAASGLANDLHRYTGGNPLFIVETVKNLLETHQLGKHLPARLPPTGRVNALITQRLSRLSPTALHLAWAAAVAQSDFDLELAAATLERSAFDLAKPWSELGRAQVFAERWFSHDLLYEATLAAIPAPIKTLLHRRCARYLEACEGNPARIAQHHAAAGDDLRAASFYLEAATRAKAIYQLAEASRFYQKAVTMLENQGAAMQAFEALADSAVLTIDNGMDGDSEALVVKLESMAQTTLQRAKACYVRATLLYVRGQGSECETAAQAGLEHALAAGDSNLQAKLLTSFGEALYIQGRIDEAAEAFKSACSLCETIGENADLASALSNVAVMLDLQDRYREAAAYYHRADELSLKLGDVGGRITILNNLGFSMREGGRARFSVEPLNKARELLKETDGAIEDQRRNLGQLGESHGQLGHYALALDYLHEAISLSEKHHLPHGFLKVSLANVYVMLGVFEEAEGLLEAALQQPAVRDRTRGVIWLAKARLLAFQNQPLQEALEQAETFTDLGNNASGLGKFWVTQALALPPDLGVERAQQALDIAEAHSFGDLEIAARTRSAQMLLALQRNREALQHSAAAVHLLESYDPIDFSPAEVLLTHYRALEACRDPYACAGLQACLDWIMNVANYHCPPEYRESFLTRNPLSRATLEAAQQLGLELPA